MALDAIALRSCEDCHRLSPLRTVLVRSEYGLFKIYFCPVHGPISVLEVMSFEREEGY